MHQVEGGSQAARRAVGAASVRAGFGCYAMARQPSVHPLRSSVGWDGFARWELSTVCSADTAAAMIAAVLVHALTPLAMHLGWRTR